MPKKTFLFIAVATVAILSACMKEQAVEDYSGRDNDTIKAYIAKKGYQAQSLPSGLYYTIIAQGDANRPKITDNVLVNYKGYFTNDKFFDYSNSYSGNPTSLQLKTLVKGWQEGLPLIGIGGKIRLYVPSALGYGTNGTRPPTGISYIVPPNTVLIFEIELFDIYR